LPARIEGFFIQVEAITTIQVAISTNWLDHDMKSRWFIVHWIKHVSPILKGITPLTNSKLEKKIFYPPNSVDFWE
jgi:hypothetical protein